MPALVWDAIGSRTFESGISKGVIYFEDGRSVVWNGLTAVTESSDRSSTVVHYDGVKIGEISSVGDFSGTISAVTYPDELLEVEGFARVGAGVYFGDQNGKKFNLSYQTKIGDDISGFEAGYKIHILYNVTAIPSDKTFATLSNSVDIEAFEWSITSVPEEVDGFRPTSRIVLDSRDILPSVLEQIELWLYGKDTANPAFPTFSDLMTYLVDNFVINITDLKDGRWMADSNYAGYINVAEDGTFQINNAEATYIDPETYTVSDTIS